MIVFFFFVYCLNFKRKIKKREKLGKKQIHINFTLKCCLFLWYKCMHFLRFLENEVSSPSDNIQFSPAKTTHHITLYKHFGKTAFLYTHV